MPDPIFDIFRSEARSNLNALEQGFLDLDVAGTHHDRIALVDRLFRHAHNLKGDARVLDLMSIQEAAGHLEETLELMRRNVEVLDSVQLEKGLRQLDELVRAYEAWLESTATPSDGNSTEPSASSEGQSPGGSSEGSRPPVWQEDARSVRVASDDLDRMLNQIGELRVLQRSDSETHRQFKELRGRLEEILRHPDDLQGALESAIDHLRRIETNVHRQQTREQLLLRSLEDDVHTVRLLPLSQLASSFRRSVRDLANGLGKEVRYEIDVGDVHLDKSVIEALRAPLLHLIRNALDHGLEMPKDRINAGKPSQGKIRLTAARRGGKVIVQLTDDGAGVDVEKIRQSILARGELTEEEAQLQSQEELLDWLFRPGFTTAPRGEISGRGVGLDVVRDTLQRIQGTVELSSVPGQGSTFTMVLPITISTIRILSVSCCGQSYGLPSAAVVKSGRVKPTELRQMNGTTVLLLENEPIRWVWLADLLQLRRNMSDVSGSELTYVILQQGHRQLAVQVDLVDEEREVLLKPLGFPLQEMDGVLGGTIQPDGSVQLVLDIGLEKVSRDLPREEPAHRETRSGATYNILIVDDSPTTRALLRNALTAAGYRVRMAVDGLDALDQMRSEKPDLVVSDFEMPRLNGVDLTRQIKSRWRIPVILVTGREQERHRLEGLEAGADAYFVKSAYRDEGLLDLIRQMIPT